MYVVMLSWSVGCLHVRVAFKAVALAYVGSTWNRWMSWLWFFHKLRDEPSVSSMLASVQEKTILEDRKHSRLRKSPVHHPTSDITTCTWPDLASFRQDLSQPVWQSLCFNCTHYQRLPRHLNIAPLVLGFHMVIIDRSIIPN